jgi:hypothetical protein
MWSHISQSIIVLASPTKIFAGDIIDKIELNQKTIIRETTCFSTIRKDPNQIYDLKRSEMIDLNCRFERVLIIIYKGLEEANIVYHGKGV